MTRSLIPWTWRRGGLTGGEDTFLSLRQEMDRLFEDFGRGLEFPAGNGETRLGTYFPRVDMTEDDKEICIKVELPGVSEKDVEVTVEENVLILKGEKRERKEEKERNFHRLECSHGSFQRNLPLPAEVETDKVEARFKDGVLEVRLPKTERARRQTRKIPVKAS